VKRPVCAKLHFPRAPKGYVNYSAQSFRQWSDYFSLREPEGSSDAVSSRLVLRPACFPAGPLCSFVSGGGGEKITNRSATNWALPTSRI